MRIDAIVLLAQLVELEAARSSPMLAALQLAAAPPFLRSLEGPGLLHRVVEALSGPEDALFFALVCRACRDAVPRFALVRRRQALPDDERRGGGGGRAGRVGAGPAGAAGVVGPRAAR
eukprot:SAG22_NODE_284_length_13033_cov_21.541828_16_plen_118_part_00